jgi:SAM-dependent methyltransferase
MSITTKKDAWFSNWFNSPYYHLLYNYRNESEARAFIHQLSSLPELKSAQRVLDLACGKGRHSRTLHELGYTTTGVDLAPDSIAEAKLEAPEGLEFAVMDMRNLAFDQKFDAVFNLFTSFGYFSSLEDNKKVISEVRANLNDDGLFCIDFLNADFVKKNLVEKEQVSRTMEGREVLFKIERKIEDGIIVKDISFQDQGKDYHFQERVQFIRSEHMIEWLKEYNFEIIYTFGDQQLQPFSAELSPRFLVVAKKK